MMPPVKAAAATDMTGITKQTLPALLGKVALLALAYFISGHLSMLLAAPPGFVSAIFPPVGLALAAVLMWGYPLLLGVFLGSVLLNLSIALSSASSFSLALLWVPCAIALGTSVQCFCASWLIRRYVGFPNPLTEDRNILWLLLIAGPFTCVISASIGTLVLYLNQIITAGQLSFSWWSWWIGDCIGVLIAMPLMFIAFAKPKEIWRSRISTVGLPLLISCALMVVLFFRTLDGEQHRLQQRFHQQAKLMAQSIKSRLDFYSGAVVPIERLFAASKDVTAEEFAIFVAAITQNNPGIRALSWNARIKPHQLPAVVQQMQTLAPGSFISERNQAGALVPVTARADYYPIVYIEPLAINRSALGYDVGSEPLRQQAMITARDKGTAAFTAPLSLVQDEHSNSGMLLFYPLYSTATTPASVAQRRLLLRGYVVAALNITEVIASALSDYQPDSFQLQVADISDEKPVTVFSKLTTAIPAYARPLLWQESFYLAGRSLKLEILPTETFLQSQSSLQPWATLTGGLLLCALLGGFLLSVTGRAEQVRRQVQQRTLELSGILDNAAEAILIFNAAGFIERANSAAIQLFGYNHKAFLQLHIAALLPELQQMNETALKDRQARASETEGISATGARLELEISLGSYSLPGHSWFICLLHDISERKKMDRLKSEFVATVSHELRTPLTSIKGSLELVNAGVLGTLPQAAGNMLSLAQKNTERLVLLVNDILDIEKLELGEARLPLSPTNMAGQLELALLQNQGYASNYAVNLSLDLQQLPAKTTVLANPQRLQQVLSNLISNAVKFSSPGSTVHLLATVQNTEILVKVCDQGPGIPAEFRSRIFQKFAQADGSDSRQRGGTGLGLSICKALMERMNGSIGFESTEGVGSTFFIVLPMVDEGPVEPTAGG